MENTSNGKSRIQPHKRQQVPHGTVYKNSCQGAIMESLDPSLVGNDIEHEMASAVNISTKKQSSQDVKSSTHHERNNMNSSTNSFGSIGKLLGTPRKHIYIFLINYTLSKGLKLLLIIYI